MVPHPIMKRTSSPHSLDDLLCVVPCYNAAPTCARVIEELKTHIRHIVAVDDGSTDGTAAELKKTGVPVLTHPENKGKGHALLTGFTHALAMPRIKGILTIDADGQHDPEDIARLAAHIPCDLIVGHRFSTRVRHQPISRRISTGVSNHLLSLLCGQPILDGQSGFRIYSRQLAEYKLRHSRGGRFEWETEVLLVAARRGFAMTFVPIKGYYPEKNFTSSYRALRDSARIAVVMASHLFKRTVSRRS